MKFLNTKVPVAARQAWCAGASSAEFSLQELHNAAVNSVDMEASVSRLRAALPGAEVGLDSTVGNLFDRAAIARR